MKKTQKQKRKPTPKQKLLARNLVLHPEWSLARSLRESGYSEKTALHRARAKVESAGTVAALKDAKTEFRAVLDRLITPRKAANGLAKITQCGDPGAALRALLRVLEIQEIIQPEDKTVIIQTVTQDFLRDIMPLVNELLAVAPQEKRDEFAAKLTKLAEGA